MTFKLHIQSTINKAYQTLGFVKRQCRQFENPDVFKTLYLSLVRPILLYSSVVWSPFQLKYKTKLERVQHRFFRIIAPRMRLPDPYIDHSYHELATVLHIPTLTSVRTYNDVIFLFKLCNNLIDCPFLLSELNFKVPLRNTRHHETFVVSKFNSSYTNNEPINRMCGHINDNQVDLFNYGLANFIDDMKTKLLDYD